MKYEGIVNVLKPPGMTSSDVVVDVRRIFEEKRVGHTGTLDPGAAGVLPICIGRATRLFDYLVDKKKEYFAEICFGTTTDTLDSFGAVTEEKDCNVTLDQLEEILPEFIGEIEQIPPIYSSLNLNGVKLYKLARKGELSAPLEERKRRVNIFELEVAQELEKNRFLIRILCSKGTYIRTLCNDIGKKLDVPAYMPFLLRTQSGNFDVGSSYTIAELKDLKEVQLLKSAIIPMDKAADNIPELKLKNLSNRNKRLLINGASININDDIEPDCVYRIYIEDNFIGLGILEESGLHITVWLGEEGTDNGKS